MANKISSEIRARCYPPGAIDLLAVKSLGISDEVKTLILRDRGDGGDVSSDSPAQSGAWTSQDGKLKIGSNFKFINLARTSLEGSSGALEDKGVGGFALRPREHFFNSLMDEDLGTDHAPVGNPAFPDVLWTSVRGLKAPSKGIPVDNDHKNHTRWQTVAPAGEPLHTRVFHTKQLANSHVQAKTVKKFLKDQSFRIDLGALQIATGQTTKARIRIAWGNGAFSYVLRQDAYPTVEWRKRTGTKTGWDVWREVTEFPLGEFKRDIMLRFKLIAGHLVIEQDGQAVDLLYSIPLAASSEGGENELELRSCSWLEGPVSVTLYGVSATIGGAYIDYCDWAGAGDSVTRTPVHENFQRTIIRNGLGIPDAVGIAKAQGWQQGGTSLKVTVTATQDEIGYVCTAKADPDGRHTPFVTAVVGLVEGNWANADVEPLDIGPAIENWSLNTSEPGGNSCAELSLKVHGDVLNQLALPGTAPSGSTWRHYLGNFQYNPLDFAVRWHYDDGTVGDWTGKLKGYIVEMPKDISSTNIVDMTIKVHDPVCRLNKPAGVIDDRYQPMSYLFAINKQKAIWAADCIKEIVRITIGDAEAARFNGNGSAVRYLPEGHPPLISSNADIAGFFPIDINLPILTGKILLKPPYLRFAMDWIHDLMEDDCAKQELSAFFYGYASGDGTLTVDGGDEEWPVPIYGQLSEILFSRGRWELPDAHMEEFDTDLFLGQMQMDIHSDKDYNRELVVNTPSRSKRDSWPGAGIFVGEARLPATDPRSQEFSWERTEVLDIAYDWIENKIVTALAQAAVFASNGVLPVFGTLTIPQAEPRMQWGDVVRCHLVNSDPTNELNNRWMRIMRLEESGSQKDKSYSSKAVVYTLSTHEIANLDLP